MKRQGKQHSTLLRQWHMLLAVPRHPYKTTAREIRDRLAAQQFETTTRTVAALAPPDRRAGAAFSK